jgi:hypothetical protein
MPPQDTRTKLDTANVAATAPRRVYSPRQEMFLLAFASNAGTNCSTANPDTPIDNCVSQAIQDELAKAELLQFYRRDSQAVPGDSRWTIVWGPGVAVIPTPSDQTIETNTGTVKAHWATNVMFVAHKEGAEEDTYFVSIAGTDSKSFFDAMEDFRVHQMCPWPHVPDELKPAKESANIPLISLGFRKGLEVLERMRPVEGLPGAHRTLDEYFGEVVRNSRRPVHITTSGHSQGGALSPLVALWLRDTQDKWDPARRVGDRISCWPFAGLTPGNLAFANYYDAHVPLTFSVINPLDVATKFFNERDLGEIPNIYSSPSDPSSDIRPGKNLRELVIVMRALVAGNEYTRIPQDRTRVMTLNGKVNTSYTPTPQPDGCKDCCNFGFQMGYQHLYAYFDLLGLETPTFPIDQFTGLCGNPNPCKLMDDV